MTPNDVMRLYAMLDESRKETRVALGEVRDEVQGYRADLNGRLRTLETLEARRSGSEMGRGSIGRLLLGVAAFAAAVGSVCGALVAIL